MAGEQAAKMSLVELGEDLVMLLVQHITESNRPARTILRSLSALSRTCRMVQDTMRGRLDEPELLTYFIIPSSTLLCLIIPSNV